MTDQPAPAGSDARPPSTGRSSLRRVLRWVALGLAVVLVVAGVGGYLVYRHLSGNIAHVGIHVAGARPAEGPGKSQNILLIGSDTRDFKGGAKFGAEIAGARSDTTILVHITADGKRAVLVSIPRDTYTRIPPCELGHGKTSAPTMNRFNAAFSIGGPSCTIATVEHLTHLRIDHFVEVNFAGFQRMVDALGGVDVCLTHPIDDPVRTNPLTGAKMGSGLVIGAGHHELDGKQALGFVRSRYAVGDGSDLGRIKNQQVFLSSMIRKATSTGLIFHPISLYKFLDAATKSIRTDPGFGLPQLRTLAGQLHGLKPGKVSLLTVPLSNPDAYVTIGGLRASVVFWDKHQANQLWHALRTDGPLPGTATKAGTHGPRLIVAPDQIHVRVLNGTHETGIAHGVAQSLAARGFVIDGVGDADTSSYASSVVRYGVDRNESSETLAASVPGSVRQQDATLGTTVELIVGRNYTGTKSVKIVPPSSSSSLDVVTAKNDVCTA